MQRFILAVLSGLLFLIIAVNRPGGAVDQPIAFDQPIPQNPTWQQQRFHDMFEWNRRTLAGAYEKVGNKNPRWDQAAREALEAAARVFSHHVDPYTEIAEVYAPAKRALDAGCDDPLILYLYARSSYKPNYPGPRKNLGAA